MPTPCVAIVNPAAANGRAGRQWRGLVRELEANGFAPEILLTGGSGDATALTRRAIMGGQETIIAIGGDGTINEVVNGFFAQSTCNHSQMHMVPTRFGEGVGHELVAQPINPKARLGVICCGTGSDLVKSIGLPPRGAAIPILAQGHVVAIDVGVVSYRDLDGQPAVRYFLNVAGLGLSGETVVRSNHTTKVLGGFVSFLWASTRTILAYRAKQVELIVDGGELLRRKVVIIVAANGQYWGGGMHAAPDARLVDGCLDIFVLGDVSRVQLLFDLLPRIYRGAHVGHPKIWSRRGKHLVVRCRSGMLVDVDGELAGMADAEIALIPAALPMLVPAGLSAALLPATR